MRSPHNWLRLRPLQASIALALVGIVLALLLWPRERITSQNFAKIRVGMSQAELRHLLGSPDYQVVEMGLVNGPKSYSINTSLSNEEKRQSGFREYQRQQWSSPKLTIIAISDFQGQIVCRYTSSGQENGDWFAFIRAWLSRCF